MICKATTMAASEKSNIVADSKITKIKLTIRQGLSKYVAYPRDSLKRNNNKLYKYVQTFFWCSWKNIEVYEGIKLSQLVIPPS